MRFIDEVEVVCISGKGGDGAASFHREKFVPRGGPDGGDGGRGGHVILRAVTELNTLESLRGRRMLKARPGRSGGPKNMTGAGGQDLVVEVPVGTMVLDAKTGDQLADLATAGSEAIVCRGGKGGYGNVHFKSSRNRTPRTAEPGGDPVTRTLRLELKLLADVGLLGFPNAGKSTLISRISGARPKVADYPFTTLVPNLGVVSFGWEDSFVVADIPGLVPGASEGTGLGHQFLRHVERCRFLLHLVSPLEFDSDVADPVTRYKALQSELAAFDTELSARLQIPVLTKADAVDADTLEAFRAELEEAAGMPPFVISAVTGDGLDALLAECRSRLRAMLEAEGAGDEVNEL